jgi:soluble lytic murein transglycosylase-like protein
LEVVVGGAVGWISADFLGTGGSVPVAGSEPSEPAGDAATVPVAAADQPRTGYSEREVVRIIHEAAERYQQPPDDMVRVARCESNLDPYAVNGPGNTHGLFQFLPGTFASTPYADHDIYDPWANANAAGWMWAEGRRGEWACQ